MLNIFVSSLNALKNTVNIAFDYRHPNFEANTTAVFEEISIEAMVPTPHTDENLNAADSTFYPVFLDTSIMPLNSHHYTYGHLTQNNKTTYSMTLNNQVGNLYCVAVWGRVSATDGEDATPPIEKDGSNSSSVKTFAVFLLALTLFSLLR